MLVACFIYFEVSELELAFLRGLVFCLDGVKITSERKLHCIYFENLIYIPTYTYYVVFQCLLNPREAYLLCR